MRSRCSGRDPKTGAGVLIVATEENEVYAFDEKTGTQIWTRTLGEPIDSGASAGFQCGDIWPLGVTGTPVIDKARASALSRRDGHARQPSAARSLCAFARRRIGRARLAGRRGEALDGSFDPMTQNQRGALALIRRARLCSLWRPRRRLRRLSRASHRFFDSRAGQGRELRDARPSRRRLGAGRRHQRRKVAVRRDRQHHGFVKEWGDGEAVLRFGPDLARPVTERDYFAPSDWKDLDAHDLDLGGTAPIPLDVPSGEGRPETDPRHRQKRRTPICSTATTSAASAASSRALT